jgi:hypothetical protein
VEHFKLVVLNANIDCVMHSIKCKSNRVEVEHLDDLIRIKTFRSLGCEINLVFLIRTDEKNFTEHEIIFFVVLNFTVPFNK